MIIILMVIIMSNDLKEFYYNEIKRLASVTRIDKRLEDPEFSIIKKSKICGSTVTIDANIDSSGLISSIGYRTRSCTLAMASTAILFEEGIGCGKEELSKTAMQLNEKLLGNEICFSEKWHKLNFFEIAKTMKQRHSSILLPFEAIIHGFKILNSQTAL